MQQHIAIKLAGQDYDVLQLPYLPSREWRQSLKAPLASLFGGVSQAFSFDLSQLSNLPGLADALELAVGSIVDAPDKIVDMLFSYSPALDADRERIVQEAYDQELVAAFVQVLKVVYPLGTLQTWLGRGQAQTLPNSRLQNGASVPVPLTQ